MEPPTDPEGEQVRDVFAHFGLAAYCAQVFEKGLCNLLVAHRILTGEVVTLAQLDGVEAKTHKQTLGTLVKDMKRFVTFEDADAGKLLDDAVGKRNFLHHDYFWERSVEFASVNGRRAMIEELDAWRPVFERAAEVATALYETARKGCGITDEAITAEIEKARKRAAELDAPVTGSGD